MVWHDDVVNLWCAMNDSHMVLHDNIAQFIKTLNTYGRGKRHKNHTPCLLSEIRTNSKNFRRLVGPHFTAGRLPPSGGFGSPEDIFVKFFSKQAGLSWGYLSFVGVKVDLSRWFSDLSKPVYEYIFSITNIHIYIF